MSDETAKLIVDDLIKRLSYKSPLERMKLRKIALECKKGNHHWLEGVAVDKVCLYCPAYIAGKKFSEMLKNNNSKAEDFHWSYGYPMKEGDEVIDK